MILIRGFSLYSGHDCSDYWQRQKDEIEKTGRKAIILGFYTGNTNCDDSVPQSNSINNYTPIKFIAEQLRDWILANYEEHISIDIVAHSMGGIVVRKMLNDFEHQLRISDVVTLGTPHNGVKAAYFNGSCLLIHQCAQQSAGSEFMNGLDANPQSKNPTQWTLIAASGDQVVGKGTAIEMSNGSSGGPPVSKYEYTNYHKHGCANLFTLGHGDLQGQNAEKGVSECNWLGQQIATVKNPTERLMLAID